MERNKDHFSSFPDGDIKVIFVIHSDIENLLNTSSMQKTNLRRRKQSKSSKSELVSAELI